MPALLALDGTTIEVNNTDAEGRLILGDAMTYAERLGATHMVDVATLKTCDCSLINCSSRLLALLLIVLPPVTFLITRRIAPALAVCYWVAQFAAATVAALLLKWVLPNSLESQSHLVVPAIGGGIGTGQAVVVEAVLTFFLVWVVFGTAVDPRSTFKQVAGLAIGLTITIDVLMGGVLTGAAMTPARAFGPQLVGNHWAHFWIWYVGPLAGAVIAASVYEMLYLRPQAAAGDAAPY